MEMYKELTEKEYEELSDKFLTLRKGLRRLNKISEEMANTLFLNTPQHPEMRNHRIETLGKKLRTTKERKR